MAREAMNEQAVEDVVVVGGGLVGSLLSIYLARKGIRRGRSHRTGRWPKQPRRGVASVANEAAPLPDGPSPRPVPLGTRPCASRSTARNPCGLAASRVKIGRLGRLIGVARVDITQCRTLDLRKPG